MLGLESLTVTINILLLECTICDEGKARVTNVLHMPGCFPTHASNVAESLAAVEMYMMHASKNTHSGKHGYAANQFWEPTSRDHAAVPKDSLAK